MAGKHKSHRPNPIQETPIPGKEKQIETEPEAWAVFAPKKRAYLRSVMKNGGLLVSAAEGIGYSDQAIRDWRKADPAFNSAVLEAAEVAGDRFGDIAEGLLFKGIVGGDKILLMFYLKCKQKKRGYVERQEVEHSGGITPVRVSAPQLEAAAKAFLKSMAEKADVGSGDQGSGI